MTNFQHLAGVYAAALTPLSPNQTINPEQILQLLDYLARRGCHGALLLGTTGEGPSFAPSERAVLLRAASQVRQTHPDFRLLAGTGTPSLQETIELTQAAFDLGMDGVVVLPPYYFRKASDDGLFAWFSQVLRSAVPSGSPLLGYHIPPVSGVPLSVDLLARLRDTFPDRFAGIKDSSGDPEHARQLSECFGKDMIILSGNDRLFSFALQNSASGSITALANLFSPDLRRLWDAHQRGEQDGLVQARLDARKDILDRYPPAPPTLKALLRRWHNFPLWDVRPPLIPLSTETEEKVAAEFEALQ